MTRVVPQTLVACSPLLTAQPLTMPVQMLIGRDNEMVQCNPAVQKEVFYQLAGPCEKVIVEGGHFGLL